MSRSFTPRGRMVVALTLAVLAAMASCVMIETGAMWGV